MNDVQMEILESIKKLAVEQATIKGHLESYLKQSDRQEKSIDEMQKKLAHVNGYVNIFKGVIWFFGVVLSGILIKVFKY